MFAVDIQLENVAEVRYSFLSDTLALKRWSSGSLPNVTGRVQQPERTVRNSKNLKYFDVTCRYLKKLKTIWNLILIAQLIR